MRSRLCPTLLAVLLAAFSASPARAAAPWSARATIPRSSDAGGLPELTFGTGDRGMAWSVAGDPSEGVGTGSILGIVRPDGGATGSRFIDSVDAAPVAYGQTRLLSPRVRVVRADPFRPLADLGVSYGRTDDRVGDFRRLARVRLLGRPALAANRVGDAVIAWREDAGNHERLWICRRRAGGPFGRPEVIRGTGSFDDVRVAVGPGRHFAVAYQRTVGNGERVTGRAMEVRLGGVGGGPGRLAEVGPSAGLSEGDVAVAPSGRTTFVWGTQDAGEEANQPWTVYAAVHPAGAGGFRAADVLDRAGAVDRPNGFVRVVAGPDGTATAAWSTVEPGTGSGEQRLRYPIHAATQDARAVFGAVEELDGSGGLEGLAVDADGVVTAAWIGYARAGGPPVGQDVRAAVRTPAGGWAPVEQVAAEPASALDAAVEPASGRPVVLWRSSAAGGGARALRFARRG
jgi:hypothetical protein